MNITRAITMFRIKGMAFRIDLRTAARKRIHALMASAFRWALSIPAVQQEIADAFDGSTPMCRVLRDAIASSNDRVEVNADDVDGLGRYIEDAVEEAFRNFEVDADDVKHLEQTVQSIIEDNAKEIAEAVSENLVITVARRR